jgi:hypothetical protein
MTLAQIAKEAKELSETEKSELANMLLDELQGPADPAVERAQVKFAEERLAAYERGEDTAIDTDEMLAKLKKKHLA